MKLNHVILTVPDVMGWSENDTIALTQRLNAYANLLGSGSEEKAIQCAQVALAVDFNFPATDINVWFHAVMALVFYELLTLLRQNGTVKHANLEQLEKQYLPVIQGADSRFNNFMDEIDFEQDKDKTMEQARMFVKP